MTAAAVRATNADLRPSPSPLAVVIARAEARASLWQAGELDLHEAVDELQAAAVAAASSPSSARTKCSASWPKHSAKFVRMRDHESSALVGAVSQRR